MAKIKRVKFFVLILFVGMLFYFAGSSSQESAIKKPQEQKSTIEVQSQHLSEHSAKKTLASKKEAVVSKEQEPSSLVQNNTLESELEALHKHYIFESVSLDEMEKYVTPRRYVEPVGALQISPSAIAEIHAECELEFVDIEGITYNLKLEGVEMMQGSSSYFGEVASYDGMHYSSIVTVGEDGTTYIHLATQNGAYEIELVDAKGYVYRSKDIHNALSDESISDVVQK